MPRFATAARRVCFVSGTRAEFGLMQRALHAIDAHPQLQLQLIVTGMHLDRSRGEGLAALRREGWRIDAAVPWRASDTLTPSGTARSTGRAIAALTDRFERLDPHVVLVVGDRVEAFAAATAGHLSGRVVAHVHGGDRAQGQVDDTLRHAITKLAHVHFPATPQSADRLLKLGEDRWRIHRVGSPGIDGIARDAADRRTIETAVGPIGRHRVALLLLHPADVDPEVEQRRAGAVLRATLGAGFERIVVLYPNTDPGAAGIVRAWERLGSSNPRITVRRDLPRGVFLGLMREVAVLVGNSSSGIIEAASFGTPVVDIGPRQAGREHGPNVVHVDYDETVIARVLRSIWRGGRPRRFAAKNLYGGVGTARRMAADLARLTIDQRLLRKRIAY